MSPDMKMYIEQLQMHINYLIECKTLMSPKQWQQQRTQILNSINGNLYWSLLQKTLYYKEFNAMRKLVIDSLSWENLLGYKQLSLFDEPNFE